jgi:hypothetical protein
VEPQAAMQSAMEGMKEAEGRQVGRSGCGVFWERLNA